MELQQQLFMERVSSLETLSLEQRLHLAGIELETEDTEAMIQALVAFLTEEENLYQLMNEMTPLERDIVILALKSGNLRRTYVDSIYHRYGLQPPSLQGEPNEYYSLDLLGKGSKASLLFFYGYIPEEIASILLKRVFTAEVQYKGSPPPHHQEETNHRIYAIGEEFITDIEEILLLIQQYKLKGVQKTCLPTKATMKKVQTILHIKEPPSAMGTPLDNMRIAEESIRIHSLFMIMWAANLIQKENKDFVLTERVEDFLAQPLAKKCEILLQAYMVCADIKEMQRIVQSSSLLNFIASRVIVLSHLKGCPVNEWVSPDTFYRGIRRCDPWLLQKPLGFFTYYDSLQEKHISGTGWSTIHEFFIDVVLIEYLATLGLVDVMFVPRAPYPDFVRLYRVQSFRLTPLGAHVLGVQKHKRYEQEGSQTGLVVQPNFELIIPNDETKNFHRFFFDRFAETVSHGVTPVYKLTFKAMARARDQGISVDEIITHLHKYSEQQLPQNVLATLQGWKEAMKKICIRTISILETEDPYLLAELKSYKTIHRYMQRDIQNAVQIKPGQKKALKREIEKKQFFCPLEEEPPEGKR